MNSVIVKLEMGITTSDIKRAILSGGDVSAFIPALRQALGSPPVSDLLSPGVPVALPEAAILLRDVDNELASLLETWSGGSGHNDSTTEKVALNVVGLAPYGRNISRYLERIIDELKPDIVTLDTSPLGLSANMLYAFSMPGAVGLPIYSEVLARDDGQIYASEAFYPGNMNQTAIVRGYLDRVPLIPVGMPSMPGRFSPGIDEGYLDREIGKANLVAAYHAFDECLEKEPNLQEGAKITEDICSSLRKAMGDGIYAALEESSYAASRISEVASFVSSPGREAKILAIVDIKHYLDVKYFLSLLAKGITDEVYLPPRPDAPMATMVMVSRHSAELDEYAEKHTPPTTLAQELFGKELEKEFRTEASEPFPEGRVDEIIAAIMSRIRDHLEVKRGASVRGAIAFKEVLQGLGDIEGRLTRSSLEQAALITLPPRISTKQGSSESAEAVVSDIVKEALYGIRFSTAETPAMLADRISQLSPEDITSALQNLGSPRRSTGQKPEVSPKGQVVIIPESSSQRDTSLQPQTRGFPQDPHALREAIERRLKELAQKLATGEISREQYRQEKRKLDELLRASSMPRYQMSRKELSDTVLELMEAKDKQWQKELSLQDVFVYYHVKGTCKGEPLSAPKRDYYGLKVLIDDLEKQGILSMAASGQSFMLTAEALDILLDYLIPKAGKGKELKERLEYGRAQLSERKHDIRRYCVGDVFRDISVRHTLREIAKQKKQLSEVSRRDFRVFMKQPRQLQSDIVLCVDTSGSMLRHQKLVHARLAAAGVARAAIENGDRVGIVTFNNLGQAIMPLSDSREEIMNYIAGISIGGGNTNIGDGIKCAAQLLLGEPSRNQRYTVLITDGQPTAITEKAFAQVKPTKEKDMTEEYAIIETRRASSSGIRTSVIHITDGEEAGKAFVQKIARLGKGQVRRVSRLNDLRAMIR